MSVRAAESVWVEPAPYNRPSLKGPLIGAVVGGLLGGLFGARHCDHECKAVAVFTGVLGAGFGMLAGTIAAVVISEREP